MRCKKKTYEQRQQSRIKRDDDNRSMTRQRTVKQLDERTGCGASSRMLLPQREKGKKTKSEGRLKCHRGRDYLESDDRSHRSITTSSCEKKKTGRGGNEHARQSWAERKDGSSNAKHLRRASRLAPQTTTERLTITRLGTATTIQAGRSKRHLPPTTTESGTSNGTLAESDSSIPLRSRPTPKSADLQHRKKAKTADSVT